MQLVVTERADHDRPVPDERPSGRVREGGSQEVGAERDHDPDRGVVIGDDVGDGGQEQVPLGRVRQGEQFLELVDDEDEIGTGRREHPPDEPGEPVRGRHHLVTRVHEFDRRYPRQRDLEIGQRTGAGNHRRDERAGGPESRQDSGPDDRGLARARRAHDRDGAAAPDLRQ